MNFAKKLTERERAAGRLREGYTYSLPTEAQWEYAARAGTRTAFHYGNSLSSRQANFDGNYPYGGAGKGPYLEKTVTVGSYERNRWGLYDMHGNVWAWCSDWYGDYSGSSVTDPTGANTGSYRVSRGGGWSSLPQYARSANRDWSAPEFRNNYLGFRVALSQSR